VFEAGGGMYPPIPPGSATDTIALRGMRLSCICVGLCHFSTLSKNVRIRSIGHVSSLPAKRYRERIIVRTVFRFFVIRFFPFL
jgi:hypothetical protein